MKPTGLLCVIFLTLMSGVPAALYAAGDAGHPEYALYFDGDGNPIAPSEGIITGCADPSAPGRQGWTVINEQCFVEKYVPMILDGIRNSGKKQVLIFVHGGLVSLSDARERVARLTDAGDAKGTLRENYYPIFINWQASLFSSYTDHLFRVRQGQRTPTIASLTSPYILLKDLVFGTVRILPDTVELVANKHGLAYPTGVCFTPPAPEYKLKIAPGSAGGDAPVDHRWGTDVRSATGKFTDGLRSVPWLPVKPLSTGILIDGLGSESWKIMERRTELVFHRDVTQEGATNPQDPRTLGAFLRRLSASISGSDTPRLDIRRIDFVAHSAGSIIMNRALQEVPELDFTDIVYMAAADTHESYEAAVWGDGTRSGYMALHPHTNVYHLVLEPKAEINENDLGYFEAEPRGSLLYWIDNFLAEPEVLRQRTMGRAENLAPRICDAPGEIGKRIHVKVFDYGVALQQPPSGDHATPAALRDWYEWCDTHRRQCQPQVHGDFSEMPFWQEWFRAPAGTPKEPGDNPD